MMMKDKLVNGPQNAAHRSLYHALGLTPEEQQRPLIAVVSSYNEIVPGHMNLDKIVEAVKLGGAMDLVVGAKKVIVAMEHTSKNGPKIVKKCSLPLTAAKEVDLIITERCVISVEPEGLVLKEINPLFSLDDVLSTISADLIVPDEFNQAAA